MNAQLAPEGIDIAAAPGGAEALLRSVVVADLCDSTALVETLGDQRAAELIRGHDKLLRQLIRQHRGQEIDKTDGFLSLFERPIQAVAFALDYQRALQAYGAEAGISLRARIGVHVGEVMIWRNEADDIERGAKPTEVEGLAKPVAARLMGLALPGQILVSQMAYVLAHRAKGELGSTLARLQWKSHGRFRFKGVADAVTVYEIGEPGIAPFRAPAWTGKAHREVPLWRRPAMIAVECVLLAALVALPLWHYLKPTPAIAFAERDWVVLADLRNLTGDPRFDGSLDQAFRIGLEQSRYVNLVSDLQVRSALDRMQRPSESEVDRATGAEIALREGARALILPTLAEVGGRVRFTAEVIDPSSQATVYSAYSDGRGAEAVLALIDEVNRDLRVQLGEAVSQVGESARSLEKVATPNLDALRAYSIAKRLVAERKLADAIALFRRALELDPGFARAEIELAIVLLGVGEEAEGQALLRSALARDDRITARESRHAEALLASASRSPRETIEAWRLLTLEFPDYFPGWGGYAWFLWQYENDVARAIEAGLKNVSDHNPQRGFGLYLLGSLHVAQGELERASAFFESAEAAGVRFENLLRSSVLAVERRFEEARQVIGQGVSSGLALSEAGRALTLASFALDQGDADAGLDTLARAAAALANQSAAVDRALLIARATVSGAVGRADPELAGLLMAQSAALLDRVEPDEARAWRDAANLATLFWALEYLAEVPEVLRERAEPLWRFDTAEFPEVRQKYLMWQARRLLKAGRAEEAVSLLAPSWTEQTLWGYSVELLEARTAAGQYAAAETLAARLSDHRGRAYTEPTDSQALRPFNVWWSTRALLRLAHAQASQGRLQEAQETLQRFRQALASASASPRLAEELAAVERLLAAQ